MNIAGVLVHANPEKLCDIRGSLAALPGVEIHEETEDGRFIVTVEDVNGADPGDAILDIHRMPGVLSAALVFHHYEQDDEDAVSTAA